MGLSFQPDYGVVKAVPMLAALDGFDSNESVVLGKNSAFIKVNKHPTIWLCLLSPNSNWLINGLAKLTLLRVSTIQICGADICRDECLSFNIYSPSTHVPTDLKVPPCTALVDLNISDLFSLVSSHSGVSSNRLQHLLNCPDLQSVDLSQFAVALMIQSLDFPVIRSIQQIPRFRMLFPSDFSHLIPNKVSVTGETYSFESASFNEAYIEASELRYLFNSLSSMQGAISPITFLFRNQEI